MMYAGAAVNAALWRVYTLFMNGKEVFEDETGKLRSTI